MRVPGNATPGRRLAVAALLAVAASLALETRAFGASVALDRGPVVLGRTESVGVTFKIEEAAGAEDRPLRLSVNVGSFSGITRKSPGVYRSVYVPPTTRFPQVVLVAVWRETGPEAPIDFLRIPLYGMATTPVQARPNSEVRVQVGIEEFGPVKADAKGKAQVAIVVPPGVAEMVIKLKDKTGVETKSSTPIPLPPYNRLTGALVPRAVLTDGKSEARLEVFYDLGGANVPANRIRVRASIGEAQFRSADRGRYVYRYVAPAGATAKEVQFNVSVDGDAQASASVTLKLGQPDPARLLVRPPDQPMPADGRSAASVAVLVLDETGLGLANQKIDLRANREPVADLADLGNGLYEGKYLAPSSFPPGGLVQLTASVRTAAGAEVRAAANYQLLAPPAAKSLVARFVPDPVPADGRTQATISFDVRDAAGMPLRGAKLILAASHGTVGPLADGAEGQYLASYVAPPTAPPGEPTLRVVDSSGGFEQSVSIPLRADPGRLLLGVRVGFTHSLGDLATPRAGLDLAVPIRLGGSYLALGASATAATANGSKDLTVEDPTTGEQRVILSVPYQAQLVPVTVRLSYELLATQRLSAYAGVGGLATFVRFQASKVGEETYRWGFGGLGFLSGGLSAGPGQMFLDVFYSYALVSGDRDQFRLQAGGVGAELGYRFRLF